MPNKTVREIINTLSDEQKTAVEMLIEAAMGDDMEHSEITDDQIDNIFSDAKREGSLKESIMKHADTYGINNIDLLFPEAQSTSSTPVIINNPVEWVDKVLSKVHPLPFARVKTIFADITADTVKARGYVKGSRKEEDVFALLKRVTEPCTIYKKQKIDRDDVVDITDFQIIPFIKAEMRLMLNEELAKAILFGDGRSASDNFKIDEECIRPIVKDDALYTIKHLIPRNEDANIYSEFIDAMLIAREDYRGSGSPSLFTTERMITGMLLLKDSTGRRLYTGIEDLKSILRVSEIVAVNEMIGLKRDTNDVLGIVCNLADYSIGQNKGGQVSMFDDFDIDYNQQKFLIETRCSGALTKPYSAICIETPSAVTYDDYKVEDEIMDDEEVIA